MSPLTKTALEDVITLNFVYNTTRAVNDPGDSHSLDMPQHISRIHEPTRQHDIRELTSSFVPAPESATQFTLQDFLSSGPELDPFGSSHQ